MKKKIHAEIIADSKNEQGQRITTFVLTYPRIIHAELLTHRLFSRNAASSRAIPAARMIADIENDPFIPVAWQKAHSGMQGTEYLENTHLVKSTWIEASKQAVESAKALTNRDELTKQLVNRILEPYQWYTSIVTATEYDNFFELRCPSYRVKGWAEWHSWKDACNHFTDFKEDTPLLDRLKCNTAQGEIHISLLAEAMWDARNESEPKKLEAGEWHIPFGDRFDTNLAIRAAEDCGLPKSITADEVKIKIAIARCARVSYLNFEGKDDYEADIKLYDRLKDMGHMSPFEHCARAMSQVEYKGHLTCGSFKGGEVRISEGWSGNFRGFVQLRKEIE